MAYDENVATRLRNALSSYTGLTEKRMMGGLCFMLNGHMVGGADQSKEGIGRFMFGVGKDNHELDLGVPGAQPMIHGGRKMTGFFFVDATRCNAAALKKWIKLAAGHASSLRPK